MRFSSFNEALLAYFHGEVELQARIKIYIPNKDIYEEPSSEGVSLVTTTVGNAILNEELPVEMRYFHLEDEVNEAGKKVKVWHLNKLLDKKELGRLVAKAHKLYGNLRTAEILDVVMTMLVKQVFPLLFPISKFRLKRQRFWPLRKKKSIKLSVCSVVV